MAFRRVGNDDASTEDKRFRKDSRSSYVYLTPDKNEAAVWEWTRYSRPVVAENYRLADGSRGTVQDEEKNKLEVPISKKIRKVCRTIWIYKDREFTLKNIDTFARYSFHEDGTFDLVERAGKHEAFGKSVSALLV